jgi:hypothetical protein
MRLLDGRDLYSTPASDIAEQVIRIPTKVTRFNIEKAITLLEKQTLRDFPEWQSNYWLKGALAFELNEDNTGDFLGWRLQYEQTMGLIVGKEEDDGGTTL